MPTKTKSSEVFSTTEKAAIKQRAAELKAQEKSKNDRAQGEKDVKAAIAKLKGSDAALAKKIHEIVMKAAPELMPTTWYGFPAYKRNGKLVCFYKQSAKFGDRYSTLGFESAANLDDGSVWPVAYALMKIGPAEEKKIAALVKKAAAAA